MTKGGKPLKTYLEKVFILGEHWLTPGREGRDLLNFPDQYSGKFMHYCFVPYCCAFVQDCNVKKIQYITMPCRNLSEYWTTLRSIIHL